MTETTAIAIVGAGRVGRALGRRWADAGHAVAFVVRDPADPKHADLAPWAAVRPTTDPVPESVVLLAVPWAAVPASVDLDLVDDAVVVDATNPLAAGARDHDRDPDRSGAEIVADLLPRARVVKAFNTTGSGNMTDPEYPAGAVTMLVAGDDDAAKATVLGLAADAGFDAVDAGPLTAARDLEHLAVLWIRLAYGLGNGPDVAFVLARR